MSIHTGCTIVHYYTKATRTSIARCSCGAQWIHSRRGIKVAGVDRAIGLHLRPTSGGSDAHRVGDTRG